MVFFGNQKNDPRRCAIFYVIAEKKPKKFRLDKI